MLDIDEKMTSNEHVRHIDKWKKKKKKDVW